MTTSKRRSGWVLGGLLGVVLAAAAISGSSPATADSKLGNGAECKWSSDCASGDCSDHKCKPKSNEKLGNGADCKWSSDCASGDCSSGKCRPKSSEKLANGMSCKWSSECASGDCSSGKCKGH